MSDKILTAEDFLRNEYNFEREDISEINVEGHHAVWMMEEYNNIKIKQIIPLILIKIAENIKVEEYLKNDWNKPFGLKKVYNIDKNSIFNLKSELEKEFIK